MKATFIKTPNVEEKSGVQVYAEELAKRLPEYGINVTRPVRKEIQIGDNYIGGYISRLAWLVFGRVSGNVIHSPNIFQLHRKANVLTIHDLEAINHPEEYGFGATLWSYFLRKVEKLDGIITPSLYVKKQVVDEGLANWENVTSIHHGIDHNRFYPDNPRTPIPLNDKPSLLIVGELRERKQIETSLSNCKTIPANILRVGPERKHVDSDVMNIILDRGGTFVDFGYVSNDELRNLYTYVDAVLYPSREEGFGFVPLEAAACGTPTIVRDIPVFNETLGPHKVQWQPDIDRMLWKASQILPTDLIQLANYYRWDKSVKQHLEVWKEIEARQ